MTDHETIHLPDPADLSPAGLAHLRGLIAGLGCLDPILALPEHPRAADPPFPFGRYRLRARLGAGRFGIVLLADEPALGRRVTVKVPQPAALADPEQRERFVREGRAAAGLDHPGIVPVFEAGELNGLPFLATGYVPGPTLARWLHDHPGPTPAPEAARLVALLAEAVHHAHERGVLHCDLTPANVLLHPSDLPAPDSLAAHRPAVTDFGLARLIADDPALTHTLRVIGTPLYMSPEQARGERRNLTARTDVYALGAILYELLTGGAPFPSPTTDGVLARVLGDPPARPRVVNSSVPRDLEAVCLKCLEKDPSRRYPSAAALADDLARFLDGRPTLARPVGPLRTVVRWGRRRPFLGTAIALAAVAWGTIPILVVGHSNRLATEVANRRIAETDAEAAERKAEEQEFYATLERVRQRRAEPHPDWGDESLADLRTLTAKRPAADALPELRSEAAAALAAVDLRPVRTLAEGFSAYAPAFSPDGKLALCGWEWEPATQRGQVRLIEPASGRAVRELMFPIDPAWTLRTNVPDGCRTVVFSPDGRWLVVGTRGGQLVRWDLAADTPVPVVWNAHTGDHPNIRFVGAGALAFATDGGTFYSSCDDSTRAWDVRNGWAQIGERKDHNLPVGVPALDGSFPIRDRGWGLHRFDPQKGETVATGTQINSPFTVTRDGQLVVGSVPPDHLLSLVALEPGARSWPLRFPEGVRDENPLIKHIGFSPDAALLVTSEEQERRIKLWDTASGLLLSDRAVSGGSGRFAFAPDGRHLAVTEAARTVLYEITGRVRETLAVGPRRRAEQFAASPDGGALVVISADPYRTPELSTWDVRNQFPIRTACRGVFFDWSRSVVAAFASTGPGFAFTTSRSHAAARGFPGERVEFSDGTAVTGEDVSDLRFAPDGRLWAVDAHRIRVWTLPGWAEQCPLENDAAARSAGMVFRGVAPGRRVSAVGRRDGRVFLLPANGSTAPPVTVFDSAVTSLTLSEDESRILVGGERGELGMIGSDGRVVTVIRGAHRDAVTAVAVGPGGWIVTGSADRTVKLWDAGLKPILTLRVGGSVRQAALSADGRLLTLLVTGERGVRRWRLDHLAAALADLGLPPGLP